MATALTAQLALIAARSTNPLDLKAQKKAHSQSLLFERSIAAAQDFDTIYQICIEGFQELCQIDARFSTFARSIFNEQSKQEDRATMTVQQNEELNEVLEKFLGLLGGRLFLKPALKAAEWLVRRFRVHEYNTVCLVFTFLPHHTTSIFPTLLSILPRNIPPALKFLHPYIESLAAPPRHAIVYAATDNQAFFSALNTYVLQVCHARHHSRGLLSFWASVVTEAVSGMLSRLKSGRREAQKQKQENILLRVLPVLNEGLSMKAISELRVACYMVLTILASKIPLAEHVLVAMMEAVVSDWSQGNAQTGLICLSLLAQQRQAVELPRKVFQALEAIGDIDEDLLFLHKGYAVEKLALGLILGIVGGLRNNTNSDRLETVRALIEARVMDEVLISTAIGSILATAKKTKPTPDNGSDIQNQLADLILRLSSSNSVGQIVQDVIKSSRIDVEQLETKLQAKLQPDNLLSTPVEDTEDIQFIEQEPKETTFDLVASCLPALAACEVSFLSSSESNLFRSLLHAFLLASPSPTNLKAFLNLPVLQRSLAVTEPLFISFLLRVWCGPYPTLARAAALDSVSELLEQEDVAFDLQAILPYLIYVLADTSFEVRHSAAKLARIIGFAYIKAEKAEKGYESWPILGRNSIYGSGKETQEITWITTTEAARFTKNVLLSNLEECLLDESHVSSLLVNAFTGSHHLDSQKYSPIEIKTSLRTSLFTFLSSHVMSTPLHAVKLRLLRTLNRVNKVGGVPRTQFLLPLLLSLKDAKEEHIAECCRKETVDSAQFMAEVVAITLPGEREGIHVLQSIISASDSSSKPHLGASVFNHIQKIWPPMKLSLQTSMAKTLLDVAFGDIQQNDGGTYQDQASETLRSLSLPKSILISILESLPEISVCIQDAAPQAKRQRTSHSHVSISAKSDANSLAHALKSTTFVLELMGSSSFETSPQLIKPLFRVLGDLQRTKDELGLEMGYLQSMVLDYLLAIVKEAKASPDLHIERSAIQADLLVDCMRTKSTPQTRNAVLLLLSNLASVAPDLVIHTVMPIFTFMSTSVLKQDDDFSVHVILQTIESVIPPLLTLLHSQKRGPMAGVSELLLNFVTAFDHMSVHSRPGLFASLIDKLGPEEFLFALLAMLTDKYPGDLKVRDFAANIAGRYDPATQLITIDKYLDLTLDALKLRPTISEHFLNLNSTHPIESTIVNLISLPIQILRTDRLKSETARILTKQDGDASKLRDMFSQVIEKVLHLTTEAQQRKSLNTICENLFTALLDLLSVSDFIPSLEYLLKRPEPSIQLEALKSLEYRISILRPGDRAAQDACLRFLPRLVPLIEGLGNTSLQTRAISCVDRIVEKYGKKSTAVVQSLAEVVSGNRCLGAADSRTRVMALLCLATIVHNVGESVVRIIPAALHLSIDCLESSFQDDTTNEQLHDAVYSFVGSLLIRIPWILLGDPLDRFLKISYGSANAGMSNSCCENRTEILRLVAKRVDSKECFAALERTWSSAVSEGPEAIKEYLEILRLGIERQPKSVVTNLSQTLIKIFLKIFDLRRMQFSPRTEDGYDDEEVDIVEQATNEVAIKMIYKLSDTSFRPLHMQMVVWAATSTSKKDKKGNLYRQFTWYSFLYKFFGTLKSIVTSYASSVIEDASSILENIIANDNDSVGLWRRVVLTLKVAFEHDQDGFWQSPSRFASISGPLIKQLERADSLSMIPEVIPAVTELAVAANSADHHKEMNSGILKYMRSDSAKVRCAAVQCEFSLTERLGEEWLALLPEMLPFISELQEDDDESVETETRKWIVRIESVLGESLDSMLQ